MSNNKQSSVEWLEIELEKLWIEKYLSPITIKPLLEQAKEMHQDEIEAVIIKQCAEQSTSNASSYADGYNEGYKRALELVKWTISNLIPPHNEQQ